MTYNKDITHCSGYLCPFREQCLRYRLTLMWAMMIEKPMASFIASQYDDKNKRCSMFRPIC